MRQPGTRCTFTRRSLRISAAAHNQQMGLLYFLADVFIKTFGITQPTERARRQAAFFILGLFMLVLVAVSAAGLLIHAAMSK